MGGRLTDLCGHPLCVYEGGPEGFTSALQPVPLERRNQLGFVATAPGAAISHGDLIRRPGHARSLSHVIYGCRYIAVSLTPTCTCHMCMCMHMHMHM